MTQSDDYLREIILTFFSHIKLILGTTLLGILMAVAIILFYPSQYEVITSFIFTGNRVEKSPDSLETTELKVVELTREDLLSEMEMIGSYDVVENTVKKIIEKNPDFFRTRVGILDRVIHVIKGDKESPDTVLPTMLKATRSIQSRLNTEILPKTNIIQVTLTTEDPAKGLEMISDISHEFIRFRSTIFNPIRAETLFEQQATAYNDALINKEEELIKLAKTFKSADPAREIENNLLIINNLREQMAIIKKETIETRQFIDFLHQQIDSDTRSHFSFIKDLSITNFGEKVQQLVIERGNLMRTFSPESVKVTRIDEQIEKTFSQLKAEVRIYLTEKESTLETLEKTLEDFDHQIQTLSIRNISLHTQQILMRRINRNINILSHSHDTFVKRWESAKISNKWNTENLFSVRVLRKPFSSGISVFPNTKGLLVVGFLAGFLIGCSAAFFLEFFDHTFKKPEDVQKYADLPAVFSIPKWN